MRTVLVTGATGFIGRHLVQRLRQDSQLTVTTYSHHQPLAKLEALVNQSDFVFHLAAVMRPPSETDYTSVNHGFTETLLGMAEATGHQVPLVLSSSTQAAQNNSYGKSKLAAEAAVTNWAQRSGSPAYIFRLTNIFGPGAKPDYSSVVATFCAHIARGEEIDIHDPAKEMSLAYVDDVVESFILCLSGQRDPSGKDPYTITPTYTITLQHLADTIQGFAAARSTGTPMEPGSEFEQRLYTTFLSYT